MGQSQQVMVVDSTWNQLHCSTCQGGDTREPGAARANGRASCPTVPAALGWHLSLPEHLLPSSTSTRTGP